MAGSSQMTKDYIKNIEEQNYSRDRDTNFQQALNETADKFIVDMKAALGTDYQKYEDKVDQILTEFTDKSNIIISSVVGDNKFETAKFTHTPHTPYKIGILKEETDSLDKLKGVVSKKYKSKNIVTQEKIPDIKNNISEPSFNGWEKIDDPNKNNYLIEATDKTDTDLTKDQIETRLTNCVDLELLYITKHRELMQLFLFTLNLFKRYKYTIRLILYLLKNLVYKKQPDEDNIENDPEITYPPIEDDKMTFNIPPSVITDISKLLKDQEKMKKVLNDMETFIGKDTPINNIHKDVPNNLPLPPPPPRATTPPKQLLTDALIDLNNSTNV